MFRLFILALAGILCGCSGAVDSLFPRTPAAPARLRSASRCTGPPVSPPYRFQLVTVDGDTTIEQALTDYSARGYRLRLADGPRLIFEKLPEGVQGPEYLALKAVDSVLLKRQLNDSASRGFRLLQTGSGIMEKERADAPSDHSQTGQFQYRYEVVDERYDVESERSALTMFGARIADVTGRGYRPTAIYSFYRAGMEDFNVVVEDLERVVVLESIEGERGYAVASDDVKVTDLDDLRGKPARLHGYRIADIDTMVALGQVYNVALLQSSGEPGRFEYVIIEPKGHSPRTVAGHIEREMNRAVSRGFRLQRGGLFLVFGWHLRLGVIMEKSTQPQLDVEYFVIGTFSTSTLKREMDDALSRGFSPIGMVTQPPAPSFIVFQRPRENC